MNGPGGAPRHELGRGSAGRWAGVALATLVAVSGTASPGVGQQPAPPVAASDSAIVRGAAIRDTLTRPPGAPPFDAVDALGLPLEAVAVPLRLVVDGAAWLVGRVTLPGAPTFPQRAIDAMRGWGAVPSVTSLGQRSGVALRLDLIRYRPFFLESGISIRGSQRHAAGLELAAAAGDRAARVEASYRRYAEPHFWGIGPDSEEGEAADYRWDRVGVEGSAGLATGPVTWEARAGWERNEVGGGFDGSRPDLVEVADSDTLFGLGAPTRFVVTGAGISVDLTRSRELQRRGFRAALDGDVFLGVGDTDSEFLRWTAELVGYLPLNPRQQLALRSVAELNRPQGGRGVPFTHLASLGGSANLRGYDRDRFRDRDLLALTSEWRYEIWRTKRGEARTEGLVFLDAGTVARRLDRLDGSDVRTGYGFGMRAVMGEDLVLLWYLAFGGEESQFRVKLSWPF